jgi:DNA-binding transcriptional LysR family regulator
MSPDFRHLRCFVAAAEELNFSAAARRLFISQQALSRTIHQLERDLGVTLFERTTRSVALTPAGWAMLGPARLSTATADDIVQVARRAAQTRFGRPLRVDVSSAGFATGALILRRLRRRHPQLVVHQLDDGVTRSLDALQGGRLDVVLGLAPGPPSAVTAEVIRREPVLLGMASNHPLAAFDKLPIAALARVELLLPPEHTAGEWVEFIHRFCALAGVRPRRWPVSTRGPVATAEVLRETRCVAPTLAWTAPPPDLVFRPLVEPTPRYVWSLMTAQRGPERAEIAAFRHCARQVRTELDWLGDAAHARVFVS